MICLLFCFILCVSRSFCKWNSTSILLSPHEFGIDPTTNVDKSTSHGFKDSNSKKAKTMITDVRHQVLQDTIPNEDEVHQVVVVIEDSDCNRSRILSTFLRDLTGPNLLYLLVNYFAYSSGIDSY